MCNLRCQLILKSPVFLSVENNSSCNSMATTIEDVLELEGKNFNELLKFCRKCGLDEEILKGNTILENVQIIANELGLPALSTQVLIIIIIY